MDRQTAADDSVNRSVQLHPDSSGLLTVWFDSPNRSVNVFDESMLQGLEAAVEHMESQRAEYRAVIFRSRKSGCFFAGADVTGIAGIQARTTARAIIERGQQLMLRIAQLPMPTIAAIDGTCLGGGLEFALACRFRLASDHPKTRLGLPEIKLGLIPGWGGTQRLPRQIGLRRALEMILSGRPVGPDRALDEGLIDQVVSSGDWDRQLALFARQVASGSGASSPVRQCRRRSWLNHFLDSTWVGRHIVCRTAARKLTDQRKLYPALDETLELLGQFSPAVAPDYAAEREAFVRLLFSGPARSLLRLFLSRDAAKKPRTWLSPRVDETQPAIREVAVVGAGAMGVGIGVAAASHGFQVVFKEIHASAIDAGRQKIAALLGSQLGQQRITQEQHDQVLSRMKFTTHWPDLAGCDLAIEAVVEVEAVKREVFGQLDRVLPPNSLVASNTSSLCVSRLLVGRRRELCGGLHFFNPVHRMDLVEVVRTEGTSEATLARLVKFVRALDKTPLVTSDKPGFLVNRVLFPYLGESVRLVQEGYDIRHVDRHMRQFGMPLGPLELIDKVGVDIAAHVARSLDASQPDSNDRALHPSQLLQTMVDQGWLGKKAQRGFYLYGDRPGQEVNEQLPRSAIAPRLGLDFCRDRLTSIQRRLVYPMLNEAVHCLDELVVTQAWMVDLGMVLGTGFAPMHGGPLQLIDALGPNVVHHNLQTLAAAYGPRFAPADGLVRAIRRKEPFLAELPETLSWESDHEHRYSTQH